MTNGHSLFSASSSAGWLNCQDFVKANYGKPDTSGVDAAYGTVGHDVAHLWGSTGRQPVERIGEVVEITQPTTGEIFKILIDEEMMSHVGVYIDICRNIEGAHFWEQRVWYSQYTPISDQGGTADHFVLTTGHLVIDDLKLGKGVQVDAEENTQAMLYALGVIIAWDWLYDIETVHIRITQPRRNHFTEWHTTKAAIMEFANTVLEKSSASLRPNRTRTATVKGCQWCKVKGCPALFKFMADMSEGAFRIESEVTSDQMDAIETSVVNGDLQINTADVRVLSDEFLGWILPYRRLIEGFWAEAWEEAERRTFRELKKIPGTKVTMGQSSREWKDEDGAVEALRKYGVEDNVIFKRLFVSPNQAEDVLRKEIGISKKKAAGLLKDYQRTNPGQPKLSLDTDDRPEFSSEGAFRIEADDAEGL